MLERVRALFGASKQSEEDHKDDGPKSKYRRAPVLLRIRSSTWFIGLAVGFGGEQFSFSAQSLFVAPRLTIVDPFSQSSWIFRRIRSPYRSFPSASRL